MSILLSFLPLLLLVAAVVLIVRKASGKETHANSSAQPVRLFFQYALAFSLFLIVTIGLAGLLGRIIDPSNLVAADQSSLASNLAFVVVGGPLLVGISVWLKKSIAGNPNDGRGFIPTFFATLAAVISLLVSMSSIIAALQSALSNDPFSGQSLSRAIIWAIAWFVVLRVSTAVIPSNDFRIQYFVGSLISGVAAVIGLVQVIAATLVIALGLEKGAMLTSGNSKALDGLVILVIAAGLWIYYWIKNANTKTEDLMWSAYVLIAGVGGSLVLAITSATVAIYRVLVWFIGDPTSQIATTYFASTPTAVASAAVGALAWWYHKSLLPLHVNRSETQRIYEYLMSAISLVASTAGLAIIIVAIIESLTLQATLAGDDATNTLLGAVTVILVGGPVWWHFWNRIQKLAKLSPESELSSPIRRIYLFLLFGIGGIAAIISLITVVFQLFNGVLGSGLGAATLSEMRFAIGILISTGIVAGYHWEIYRHEKDVDVSFGVTIVKVLLVGPSDDEFARELHLATGAQITLWNRTDSSDLVWPRQSVIDLVTQASGDQLLVLLDSTGIKVIPISL